MNNKMSRVPSSVLNYTPLKGVQANSNNIYSKFGSLLADYLSYSNKQAAKPSGIQFDPTQLDTTLSSGNFSSLIDNLSSVGFSNSSQKNSFVSAIDSYIGSNNISPTSEQGLSLYSLKTTVNSVGVNLFTTTNQANSVFTDPSSRFLTDNLGSFLKNTTGISLGNANNYTDGSDLDNRLYDEVFLPAITSAKSDTNLLARPTAMGSFLDYDFSSVLPSITDPDLKAYVQNTKEPMGCYKFYDMDATSNSIAIDIPSNVYSKTQVTDTSVYTPYYIPNNTLEKIDPIGITSGDLTSTKAIYSCNKSQDDNTSDFYSPISDASYNSYIGDSDIGDIGSEMSSIFDAGSW